MNQVRSTLVFGLGTDTLTQLRLETMARRDQAPKRDGSAREEEKELNLYLGLEGLRMFFKDKNKLWLYRVSQEECARLRESVPYVKVYRYNPKHLYPKLNSYEDNGQRKVRSSCGSTYCTFSADAFHVLCACR